MSPSSVGPTWGLHGGAHAHFWISVLKVAGKWVMITEQLGPENTDDDFDAAVRGLQPIVDSISWN